MMGPYLSGPQLPPLVQTVDESGRQTDVISHHWLVVSQAVNAANTSTQISVDHRRQFTVSELERHTHTLNTPSIHVSVGSD